MNTGAIDYIWQPSRDSERSDELQFRADALRQKAEAAASFVTGHTLRVDDGYTTQ